MKVLSSPCDVKGHESIPWLVCTYRTLEPRKLRIVHIPKALCLRHAQLEKASVQNAELVDKTCCNNSRRKAGNLQQLAGGRWTLLQHCKDPSPQASNVPTLGHLRRFDTIRSTVRQHRRPGLHSHRRVVFLLVLRPPPLAPGGGDDLPLMLQGVGP